MQSQTRISWRASMLGERGYIPSIRTCLWMFLHLTNIAFGPIIHYAVQISKMMCQQNCWLRQANKVRQGTLGDAPQIISSYIQL